MELVDLPSHYMQLVLSGERLYQKPGAVVTAVLITTLSIGCALIEDYIQFSYHTMPLNIVGRILCSIIFLFQFDLLVNIGKRKILMLFYIALIPFTDNSVFVHLLFLILFNCMFFGNQSSNIKSIERSKEGIKR